MYSRLSEAIVRFDLLMPLRVYPSVASALGRGAFVTTSCAMFFATPLGAVFCRLAGCGVLPPRHARCFCHPIGCGVFATLNNSVYCYRKPRHGFVRICPLPFYFYAVFCVTKSRFLAKTLKHRRNMVKNGRYQIRSKSSLATAAYSREPLP